MALKIPIRQSPNCAGVQFGKKLGIHTTRVRMIVTIGPSLRPIVALSDDYQSR